METTNTKPGCNCGEKKQGYSIFLACSGAADVGSIADRTARELVKERRGMMSCLAGIAAGVEDIMKKTTDADKILVIDGCGKECAKKIMDKNNFKNFSYLRVTDCGLEKGKSPANEENVKKVAEAAKELLK